MPSRKVKFTSKLIEWRCYSRNSRTLLIKVPRYVWNKVKPGKVYLVKLQELE